MSLSPTIPSSTSITPIPPSIPSPHTPPTTIFIIGPPGSGKGTQSTLLTQHFQIHHLSIGTLLRAELLIPESLYAEIIRNNIAQGRVGPKEMTVGLLRGAMAGKEGVVIVDGFPRSLDRASLFEKEVGVPKMVLFLDCREEVLERRLLERGRGDDGLETVRKRMGAFRGEGMDVVRHYEGRGLVFRVDGEGDVEAVFGEVCRVVRRGLGGLLRVRE